MSGQHAFAAALLAPRLDPPAGLHGRGGRGAGRRFDIYRNNVVASLIAAMETGFPVVRALVGAEFFTAMAGEFVRAHPPSSPRLMLYGTAFPVFLAAFAPVAHLGYLADVARLELALRESYHAADATPLDPRILTTYTAEDLARMRLRLAPALRLIRSDWPVLGIWQAHHGGRPPQPGPQDVLIARPGFDPVPLLLPQGGGAVIAALKEGKSLGSALECADSEFQDSDILELLNILLKHGAICGFQGEGHNA
ncbi:HvfC/BufC N-terminal domain-containing protein [Rhodovulum adriaticum]|uniref:Putative DNA-binding protein n=1 Tax=Rhodovulum adriaticum TaxID=35804 RepID=A0A4R2NXP6_RHOAD|nr:DNA-binding domain-containing protein [Rhodovulum adriaticum]MBK1635226.1 hypothetical protein [Rhodovulum adriaticum]TCP26361.1 putative DNA-binding protein [Rhodovulum adriaticum]